MKGPPAGAELWSLTAHHSPIGMALVGLDGATFQVNPALCETLGRDAEWLVEHGFHDITHPDDLAHDVDLLQRAVAGEIDSYRIRKRYLHADGHVVWGDLSVALLRDQDGRPVHFISQILDITAQHHHEERLESARVEVDRERERLDAVFETVGVGLLILGPDGTYERMNRRHQETMAMPFPDGHRGSAGQLGQVFLPDGSLMSRDEMPSYRAAQGEEFDAYIYWVGEDPLTRSAFSVSARQIRDSDGERIGAAMAYQEVTDLMRAVRVRDEFVSSVSHELRTPLTSVLGHLEMLCERDDLSDDVADRLRAVQRNAARLQALVSDLLQVARVSEGGLELQFRRVDLAALVGEAVDAIRPMAVDLGVRIQASLPERLVALVDEQRIRQVVDNLLSNALKYTEAGGRVDVRLEDDESVANLTVTDTGIGLTAEEINQVFLRFFRGDGALERQIPGTGLGLDIVRSIVRAHDGEVTVRSEIGRGSTFGVTLPRNRG